MLKTAKSLINEKIIESQELRLKVLAEKRREIIQYKTAYIEFVSVVEVEPEIIPKKKQRLAKIEKIYNIKNTDCSSNCSSRKF